MKAVGGRDPVRRVRDYVASHWRGEQSLARSFWINLVLLRTSIFALQAHRAPSGSEHRGRLALALIVLVHGVVFLWQVVGTLRAAERDLVRSGSPAPAWGAQLGAVVLCFLTFAYAVEGWQTTRARPERERLDQLVERERRARYSLDLDASRSELRLRGTIELGVTRRAESLLRQTPAIARIVLDSAGGNVYEARGLARLMRENALASHVDDRCASACAIAFIGGSPRSISGAGRLGFHQYRLEDGRGSLNSDPREAQRRDQAMFRRAGVATSFVERLFSVPPDDMWWPTPAELLAARVVNRVSAK